MIGDKIFHIKKEIIAATLAEAVSHESEGVIIEVWQKEIDTSAIGFITHNN